MSAIELLEKAAGHLKDRAATYDKPEGERSIGAAVGAFNTITGDGMMNSEERGWLFMVVLKMVRSQQGNYRADNYEDMAVYSALMGESACEERNGGWTDEEIKAAAFKDTFHSSGNDWPNDVKPFISPLTMPDSFWNMLTPEIVAIAKDEDGFWHGFEGPPMLYDEGAWGDGLFHYHLETYPQEIFPECSPKDSLILRPTGDSL